MRSEETREIVAKALERFKTDKNPDDRLNCLWKISQLVEDITDDELYELASVVAVEEDPRLRGEICYAISRSKRPGLVHLIKDMVQDRHPYVRDEATKAITTLDDLNKATIAVIEPIISIANDIKIAMQKIENELDQIRGSMTTSTTPVIKSSGLEEVTMNERMLSWETYLRHEKELLENHKGKFVAIYKAEIIAIDESDEKLAKLIYDKYGTVEAFICKIEEESNEPIRLPISERYIIE
jgi:hypothetical protein